MANFAALKATINANITDNNSGDIDGPKLNNVLTQMVNTLGTGYEFAGVATPSSTPAATDAKVFYIAGEAGTYTNFGGLVVSSGEVAILKYDTAWSKVSTPMATASEVSQLGQKVDELGDDVADNAENIVNLQQEIDNINPIVIEGNVTNAPDEEDLTTDDNDLLKFADRSTAVNQKGYKILRKSVTFAAQVTDANTIYEIRYPFNLTTDVTIPAGCILKFVGGCIVSTDKILTGNGTQLENVGDGVIFDFSNLGIAGTWNVPVIHSYWFKDLSWDNALKNVIALSNTNIKNTIIIQKASYDYVMAFSTNHEMGLRLNSNTDLIIDGVIRVRGNGLIGYRTICGFEESHINITGAGELIGDYYSDDETAPATGKHDFSAEGTHEFCHGILFYDSINININGLKIGRFPGDCIAIANTSVDAINRHKVQGCELYKSRRQGISVIGHNVVIQNNFFHDIVGTAPQCAIDVEPNGADFTCSDVLIDNNIVEDCFNGFGCYALLGDVKNVTISNNIVKVTHYAVVSDGPYMDGLQIVNNDLKSEQFAIVAQNPINRCFVINNNIVGKSSSLLFGKITTDTKCKNICIENNSIVSGSAAITSVDDICGDNIVVKNNTYEVMGTPHKIGTYKGTNFIVENNAFDNCWVEGTISVAKIANNNFDIDIDTATGTITLVNFQFNNNTYTFNATSASRTSAVRFTDCVMGEIKNNTFNLPAGRKVSNVVWFTGSCDKIECKNQRFNGGNDKAWSCILNSASGEISIEGVFTNFRADSTIPALAENNDIQRERVVYVDNANKRAVISDGTNQYDVLGNPLTTLYAQKLTGPTSSRPSASTAGVGATYFDTDLGKMIVSNGSAWVNMDGTALA